MTKKSAVNATKNTCRNYLPLGGVFTRIVLFSTLAIFTALTFTSCENFLNGADFKKQLEDDIAYAKASAYEIRIEADEGSGTIVTGNILNKKVTDSFDIEFKLASGYKFLRWQAYTRGQDGTLAPLSEDYIKFTSYDTKSDGVYKVTAKYIKEAKGIVIKPVCALFPEVVSYSPADALEINYSNTPIVIKFNSAMVPSQEDLKLLNYNNISITYNGSNYADFFEEPVFDIQSKSLTLNPKIQDFYDELKKLNLPFVELQVSLSDKIAVTKEENLLPLLQNDKTVFSVRYKAEMETTPPQKIIFGASKTAVAIDSVDNVNDSFLMKNDINSFTNDDIRQNHTEGTIYIYGKYFDIGSGVNSVIVTEQLIRNTKAVEVESESYSSSFSENDENIDFYNDKNGNTYFVVSYECNSYDGAVRISVSVTDKSGNASEKEDFIVFKKNLSTSIGNIGLYNIPYSIQKNIVKNSSTTDKDLIEDLVCNYYDYARNIKVYAGVNKEIDGWLDLNIYDNTEISIESFSLECEYTDKDGNFRNETFSEFDDENRCWNLTLNLETLAGKTVKVIVYDGDKYIGEKEFSFPSKLLGCVIKKNKTWVTYDFFSENLRYLFAYTDSKYRYLTDPGTATIPVGESWEKFNVIPQYGYLWGDVSEWETNENQEEIEQVSVKDVSLAKSTTKGYVDIFISLNEGQWDEYDLIYFEFNSFTSINGNSAKYSDKKFMNSKEDTFVYKALFNYIYEAEGSLTFYGIKGSLCSKENIVSIPKLTDEDYLEYDNAPPKPGKTSRIDYENYCQEFKDYETYVAWCRATCADGNAYYSENDGSDDYEPKLLIPCYSLDQSNTVLLETGDIAGNSYASEYTFDLKTSGTYTHFEKNESGTWNFISDEVDSSISNYGSHIYAWQFTPENNWENICSNLNKSKSKVNGVEGGTIYSLNKIDFSKSKDESVVLLDDTYIKVYTVYSNDLSEIKFFYTGEKSSGDYDLILANGNSKSSVAISSDAPVLVRTMVTARSYRECSSWNIVDWESCLRKNVDEKLIEFSQSVTGPKKYSIPVEEINAGDCYCVIAHFADGSTAMSEVMQR